MAAATQYPYDKTPAAAVSAADLGADAAGFVLADELADEHGNERAPVQDGTELYAAMVNRLLETAVGADALTPSLRVTIRFNAGTPAVDSFLAKRTTLRTEDIDFVDNGDGDTTVRVADTSLPPKRGEPGAYVHEGTKPTLEVAHYTATGWRGARVKTWDNGSAADLLTTVEIW